MKDPSEGVKTTLVLQKTASQQRVLSYFKEHEKLIAVKAVIDAEFWKYEINIGTELGEVKAALDEETGCANEGEKERGRLFLSEKSYKLQLRYRPVFSKKVKNLQYQLHALLLKSFRPKKLWSFCNVSWILPELPLIVIVKVYLTFPKVQKRTSQMALAAVCFRSYRKLGN